MVEPPTPARLRATSHWVSRIAFCHFLAQQSAQNGRGQVEGQATDDHRLVEPGFQDIGVLDLGARECVFKVTDPRLVEFHERERPAEFVQLGSHRAGAGPDLQDGAGGGAGQLRDRVQS